MSLRIGIGTNLRIQGAFNWIRYWLTRYPSVLALTVISDTRIDLAWTNNGVVDYDGISIERSLDGITYAEIITVAAGSVAYSNIGLTTNTLYYYRIRYYRGTYYSAYSNVDSDTTYYYFITTWQTENAGSATKTIVIPTTGGGYDCWINWGDGSAEENAVGTPGDITHVYATTGIKTVKIRGLFPRIYFNNAGDKLKLLTIAQWGNIAWGSMGNAFYGCANLTGTYTDIPNTAGTTIMTSMFRSCTVFNSPIYFNTSSVTDMAIMLFACGVFNQDISGLDVRLVTTMANMLSGANALSTANYDALLIAWGAQAVQNNVPFHAGDATYTLGGAAAAARAHLVLAVASGGHAWTITDGGGI